jgi:hypothetical protein
LSRGKEINKMLRTYWFEITGEYDKNCGYEFFIEQDNGTKESAIAEAEKLFPGSEITCYGKVTGWEAETMGLDTY